MGTISNNIHDSTPFLGDMAAAVEEEDEEKSDGPSNDQSSRYSIADREPCSFSSAKYALIEHDKAKLDAAERNDLHQLNGKLDLCPVTVNSAMTDDRFPR